MVDVLVFSKDRAAQLDLLLRSIARHAPGTYRSVTVLWTISGGDHAAGYITCMDEHDGVAFVRESSSFEGDVRYWLDRTAAGPLVSFLVDDDVFYRPAPPVRSAPWSFRAADLDYPFSLDGNVYLEGDVRVLLEGLPFACPTELEWFGHEHRARLPFQTVPRPPYGCLVGVPANRVATVGGMPHRGDLVLEPDQLLERYLDGARLELAVEPTPGLAHVPIEGPFPYRWTRQPAYVPSSFDE